MNEIWHQNFDPLSNPVLSTIAAAIAVCTLFYFLAVRRTPAWLASVYSFAAGIAVALGIFHMPAHMAAGAVADGLVYGWLGIAWILVAAVFIYDVSVETKQFEINKQLIGGISADRRLPVLLIAFAFAALLEGAGGGVMGKMIAAQSLVIAATVTGQDGQEGAIFRAVLKHSLGLAALVGSIVLMYAYVFPGAVPNGHRSLSGGGTRGFSIQLPRSAGLTLQNKLG